MIEEEEYYYDGDYYDGDCYFLISKLNSYFGIPFCILLFFLLFPYLHGLFFW